MIVEDQRGKEVRTSLSFGRSPARLREQQLRGMSNPQRSLGLDSSALSPKEFDAYYPLIHSHSHQTTQSHQQGTTVADIWGWLKDNAIGDVNSSIENEVRHFLELGCTLKMNDEVGGALNTEVRAGAFSELASLA